MNCKFWSAILALVASALILISCASRPPDDRIKRDDYERYTRVDTDRAHEFLDKTVTGYEVLGISKSNDLVAVLLRIDQLKDYGHAFSRTRYEQKLQTTVAFYYKKFGKEWILEGTDVKDSKRFDKINKPW